MGDWLFVFEDDGYRKGWHLRIDSEEMLGEYLKEQNLFQKDRDHYLKIKDAGFTGNNLVAHTEFGYYAEDVSKTMGVDIPCAYGILAMMQKESMKNILRKTGAVYINSTGGFHGERAVCTHTAFVRRDTPEFPHYFSRDIRVKMFPGGTHWYAYVGDMQVRDGDILKWNSYEEAYAMAEKYVRDRNL